MTSETSRRCTKIFEAHRPEVVFHAAALKHLPLLEQYPEEGWKTNVHGTLDVLECAAEFDVETFVNISTDKAADPTSVLGKTKRRAEELTAWFAQNYNGNFPVRQIRKCSGFTWVCSSYVHSTD